MAPSRDVEALQLQLPGDGKHEEGSIDNESIITPLPPAYKSAPYRSSSGRKWLPLRAEIGTFSLTPIYEKRTLSQPAKVFGIRRLYCLAATGILFLIILIIGLAAGLAGKKKLNVFLPLPTSSQTFQGDATYYDTGLGACGWDNPGTEFVVAVSHLLWDSQSVGSNPNANPLCGLRIRATRYRANNEPFLVGAPGAKNTPGGKNVSVDVKIVDRCVGCAPTDLDFSRAAFDVLADQANGRVLMDWAWL
ncbi:hypothetical protein H072_3776 [Dactylellina haptotyla CBS 200.50]|uniref:RlpA-like protein double-psi beta-barrel domain-containing protein n=1 Tax=Dactylellina haptotyla (strain CBS 200.50) TaxID=1284197 RepID=S8AHC0_DACHA|nr:hypothetical protein H072_3776 [Dactylellina haptotyla CBS 200.50]